MKKTPCSKKWCILWAMFGLLTAAITSPQVEAAGMTAFTIGGGGAYVPIYIGSQEFSEKLIPLIDMEYRTTNFDLFLSTLNGIGLRMKGDSFADVNTAVGIHVGQERDPGEDDVKKFLAGTPKLINDLQVFASVGVNLEPIEICSKIRWFPVMTEYEGSNRPDKNYDGLLAEIAAAGFFR